jgi:hypothetical protein
MGTTNQESSLVQRTRGRTRSRTHDRCPSWSTLPHCPRNATSLQYWYIYHAWSTYWDMQLPPVAKLTSKALRRLRHSRSSCKWSRKHSRRQRRTFLALASKEAWKAGTLSRQLTARATVGTLGAISVGTRPQFGDPHICTTQLTASCEVT